METHKQKLSGGNSGGNGSSKCRGGKSIHKEKLVHENGVPHSVDLWDRATAEESTFPSIPIYSPTAIP